MNLAHYFQKLERLDPRQWTGEVTEMIGLIVESNGPAAAICGGCILICPASRNRK